MKDKYALCVGIAGVIAGIFSIGFALGSRKKLNDICEKMDTAADKVATNIDVKVQETVVNEAIDRAVENAVTKEVKYATTAIIKEINSKVDLEVHSAVNASYSEIKNLVTNKTNQIVSSIDANSIRRDIELEAKEKMIEKFDNSLEGLLNEFNRKLKNTSDIYSSIAETMRPAYRKEMI